MDYKKKGEEELNLAKDDYLRVFKRYNHWSYVSPTSRTVWLNAALRFKHPIGCQRRDRRPWLGTLMVHR